MIDPLASRRTDREPLVACILVTWNNWGHTERCLEALARQQGRLLIVVVDNGSADDSIEQIRSRYPEILCIENGYNAGFPKACNIGCQLAFEHGAEFLWFLNNDTEPPPDTLLQLVTEAHADDRVGVVGSVLYYMHERESIQAWGGGEISVWSGFNRHFTAPHPLTRKVYITFASALVRRRTYEQLGGLWEGVFMYFEDADFSLRAVAAGWHLAVAAGTSVLHAEGASRSRRRHPLMERIQTASGLRFLERHGPVPLVPPLVFFLLRLGKRVFLRDWGAFQGVLAGWRDWRRGSIVPFHDERK